ncbi:hypothetical protein [Actinophytocola sp.]|uniref:hypothetical protein n=1 Tax=Actinophytocola sp. TaxID=1872138 RepID=UPI003D6C17AE
MNDLTVVVDFGATDTVGVLRRHGEAPRPVMVDGETRVPSAVALSSDNQLVAGREAAALGTVAPNRVVSDLKYRLDRRDIMVGDIPLPVTRLLRRLLARVVQAAASSGAVTELVLTHPPGWPAERVAVLTRAAAGLAPTVRTVVAPLAAAAGADLEANQTLLVLELDGDAGTATAVRRKSGKLTVVSSAELPADVQVAKMAKSADAVLVVGRSSRTPVLARRLTELGRSVRVDPDPATAVARGALRVDEQHAGAGRSVQSRPGLRRAVVAAAGVVLVASLAAVLALGWGPGQRMAGSPGPAAGALVEDPSVDGGQAIPPVVAGQERVEAGQPAFVTVRPGVPATYRTAVGAELEIVVQGVRAESLIAALGDAPAGYRWLTVLLSGTNTSGPDWEGDLSRSVSLIDDRGLWIRPLGDGVVECEAGASKPPKIVPRGQRFEACVVMPVPERTPVTAVVFGSISTDAEAQRPIRVPVAVPRVTRAKPATPFVVGTVGEPPVEVTMADTTMRAGFDVVLTPSGYVGDRRPAPGNRFVVVRAALGTADDVFLRDDRGVLSRATPGFDRMPDCPPFIGPGTPERPVYACFVYELDADAKVAGVTYGDLAPNAPLSGRELERWPTWTTG